MKAHRKHPTRRLLYPLFLCSVALNLSCSESPTGPAENLFPRIVNNTITGIVEKWTKGERKIIASLGPTFDTTRYSYMGSGSIYSSGYFIVHLKTPSDSALMHVAASIQGCGWGFSETSPSAKMLYSYLSLHVLDDSIENGWPFDGTIRGGSGPYPWISKDGEFFMEITYVTEADTVSGSADCRWAKYLYDCKFTAGWNFIYEQLVGNASGDTHTMRITTMPVAAKRPMWWWY